MHELGIRLKELRLKNKLTQLQVAQRLGISKAVFPHMKWHHDILLMIF